MIAPSCSRRRAGRVLKSRGRGCCPPSGPCAWRPPSRGPSAAPAGPAPLEITADTVLDPAKTYGPIVIKASNITIDGHGAWVIGARQGDPKDFKGIGIAAKGVSNVTLKNINAKGWDIGLKVEKGSKWLVENCNFSDNFHYPEAGWGEIGQHGGIVLERRRSFHPPQEQGQPGLGRLPVGELERQPGRGKRLLRHLEQLREAVGRLPQPLREEQSQSWHPHLSGRGPRPRFGRRAGPGLLERQLLRRQRHHLRRRRRVPASLRRGQHAATCSSRTTPRTPTTIASRPNARATSIATTRPTTAATASGSACRTSRSSRTTSAATTVRPAGCTTRRGNSSTCQADSKTAPAASSCSATCNHIIVRGNKCIGNNGAGICLAINASPKQQSRVFHWVIENNIIRDNRWGIYMECADWIDIAGNVMEKQPRRRHSGRLQHATSRSTRTIPRSPARPRPSWSRRLPPNRAI